MTSVTLPPLSSIALDDPLFYASQPFDAYRHLRSEAPVFWYERGGFWALSKHADIVKASRSPDVFSSAHGITIDEHAHPERVEARKLPESEFMVTTDPPRHGDMRRVLAHHFTTKAVAQFAEGIRSIVNANLDEAAAFGVADFAEVVSSRTAIQAICLGLDLPPEDWKLLKRLSAQQHAGFDAVDEKDFAAAIDAEVALRDYFAEKLADRRRQPRGEHDWMTTLVQARVAGEPLPLNTQLLFCVELLVAGNETSDPLFANSALGLWHQQEERARLIAQPDLMPNAVNELLRWVTPVVALGRTATQDTEIRGQQISKGDFVVLLYTSANRDEKVWGEDAERIDVSRGGLARQLAFGTGIHVCLGAHLARLEARIVLEQLLSRYPDYEVAGEVQRTPSIEVNAIRKLPIALRG